MKPSIEKATDAAVAMFDGLWGNRWWQDEHMRDSPGRMVKALAEMTDPDETDINKFTTFNSDIDEMVVVDQIPFHTLCAHHLLPFIGICHIGYVPNGKLAGLSKFPRAVRYFSRKPTVQEELTAEVADFLQEKLDPVGVAVVMKAEHTCMTVRGVQTHGALTTTSKMTGCFADHTKQARAEFLQLVNGGHHA